LPVRTSAENSPQAAATAFARALGQRCDRHFGARILGIYLIGSLAHGGFGPRYSDIDLALIVRDQLGGDELDLVRREAAAESSRHAPMLSLFWADREFRIGRFPPLDRLDLIDHAVTLIERERVRPPRPTREGIRSYLRGEPLRNWSDEVLRLAALKTLAAEDHKRYLRALLYPARILYSWQTGAIASNDDAVAFLESANVGLDIDLIKRALHCRNRGSDPDALFSERCKLPAQRHAVLTHVDAAD
jgi:predicted nucleotidyltransferase